MKKYLCLLAVLFVCLAGCSSRYDSGAIQTYLDATQQLQEVDSMHLDISGKVYLEEDKEQSIARVGMNGDMILEGPMQMAFDLEYAFSGIAFDDLHFYIKDNTMYLDMFEEKTKISFQQYAALIDALQDANTDTAAADEDSVKEMFKEFKYKDKEAGIIAFSFDLDRLEEMSGGMSGGAKLKDFIKSYTGTMKIQDQTLTELSFDLVVAVEGKQYPVSVTVSFAKQNEIKKIKFPSFKGYKEQSMQLDEAADLIDEAGSEL